MVIIRFFEPLSTAAQEKWLLREPWPSSCSFFSFLPGSPDLRTLLTFVESVLEDDDGQ